MLSFYETDYHGGTTMKNSPGTTDTISLTQIIFSEGLNSLIQFNKNSMLRQVFSATQNLLSSYKEEIQICIATVTIGAIFLGSIFIFFTQLSKYGW
jgi:hypothetical protein